MMENRLFLSLLSIVMIVAVGSGVFTKASYATETVQVETYLQNASQTMVSLDEDTHYLGIYFDTNLADIAQLQNNSDLIAKVKATNERVDYLHALLTSVDIEEVYKGDVKKGDHVYLYEPSSFYGPSYFVKGGYNIMLGGADYIVFLKHLKVPAGYTYQGREAISYMPVSTYYSKYPLESKDTTKIVSQGSGATYEKVKNYDIVTMDSKVLAKYQELKQEVLAKWH